MNPHFYEGNLEYKGRTFYFYFRLIYTSVHGWRAYIIHAPSYEGRDEGIAAHRLIDNGQYYICWSSRVDTREVMEKIADLWARATVMYIVDGGVSITDYVSRLQASNS